MSAPYTLHPLDRWLQDEPEDMTDEEWDAAEDAEDAYWDHVFEASRGN